MRVVPPLYLTLAHGGEGKALWFVLRTTRRVSAPLMANGARVALYLAEDSQFFSISEGSVPFAIALNGSLCWSRGRKIAQVTSRQSLVQTRFLLFVGSKLRTKSP